MARIKLAVLDHNLHTKRGIARNKNGEQIYSRRYRDVTPCKEAKKYEYLPLLMQDILTSRRESTDGLKNKESVPQDHPRRIQQTIAHQPPMNTKDIVMNKKSRFVNNYNVVEYRIAGNFRGRKISRLSHQNILRIIFRGSIGQSVK